MKTFFDYAIFSGDWLIGRIHERRGFSPGVVRSWHRPDKAAAIRTNGSTTSLEEAKAELQKSWDAWKAWAKLEEAEYLAG